MADQLTITGPARSVIEADRSVSPWVRRAAPAVLTVTLALYVLAYAHWPAMSMQIDAMVYRFGATRALEGLDLYSTGFTGNPKELLFVYPPFAALCFLPMALLGELAFKALWLLAACALVAFACWRMLTSIGLTRAGGLWALTALAAGLVAWLEPIRLTLQLGQINILILAVVTADLLGPKGRKWAGIGIGLVAGIKLTPALFIIYLAAIGRLRAAVVATATFVATIAVGFAVLPSDSRFYWLRGGFDEIGRISANPQLNTSLHGLFERLHYPMALVTPAAAVIAIAALAVAAIAYRRGHAVLGMAIVGLASCAASPFSWGHHWVWFAPLLVHLTYRAYVLRSTYSTWTLWLLAAVLGGWFTSWKTGSPEAGVLSLPVGDIWHALLPGAYISVFAAVLVVTAVWLWRSERDQSAWLPSLRSPRPRRSHEITTC